MHDGIVGIQLGSHPMTRATCLTAMPITITITCSLHHRYGPPPPSSSHLVLVDSSAPRMALPLYGCRSCAVHDAIVFCLCCVARLCLHCDAAVHRATDAPAVLRCGGTVTLCAVCAGRGAPGFTRTGVATYTGCPGPAEMARLISVDPPQPQQDFEAWLADKLPRLLEDDEQDHQLPPDWDVAMETARLEKMLADSCYTQPEVVYVRYCIIYVN